MYDELVKALHDGAEFLEISTPGIENSFAKMCHNAADAIEELSKPRWIPVSERLPEEEEPVFVVRKFLGLKGQVPPSTYTEIAYRCGDRWIADSDEYKIARHRHTDPLYWMPLPQPPENAEAVTHEEPFKRYTVHEAIQLLKTYDAKKADEEDLQFMRFLYNVIQPNEMERYKAMYSAHNDPRCVATEGEE